MTKTSLQAVFLRHSNVGGKTNIGNIIPLNVLSDFSEAVTNNIIVSYYENNTEWAALGINQVFFKNKYTNFNLVECAYSNIESVRPFPYNWDTEFPFSISKSIIFIKLKDSKLNYLKVEEGSPRNAFIQVLNRLI